MFSTMKSILRKFELSQYNEFTIENYFRKKGYMVGKNNRIFIRDLGSEPYLIKIGNYCIIGSGVQFITHDGAVGLFRDEFPDINIFGKIEVRDKSFIGINSTILPDVLIGPNSIIGAGSIVTKDVLPNTVVAGIPAKVICSIEEYKEKIVKKWEALALKGHRKTWENQLKEYFWTTTND